MMNLRANHKYMHDSKSDIACPLNVAETNIKYIMRK